MIAASCPRPARRRWPRSSACSACIATPTAASTCGTSTTSSAAITASRSPTASSARPPTGRAPARLGIDHIGAYSPQARGRGERLNRTLQGRLINELRLAGVTTLAAANAYLWEQFIPDYNATFTRPASDPTSAFVPLGDVDLEQILCEEEDRVVGPDNIVSFDGVHLQLAKQPGRPTCAGLRVIVRRHLDGSHTVWRGAHCLGRLTAQGAAVPAVVARALTRLFPLPRPSLPPPRALPAP